MNKNNKVTGTGWVIVADSFISDTSFRRKRSQCIKDFVNLFDRRWNWGRLRRKYGYKCVKAIKTITVTS